VTADQVADSRGWYNPHWHYDNQPEVREALDLIFSDHFSRNEPGIFCAPARHPWLTHGDYYMHLADLASYSRPMPASARCTPTEEAWARKAILNVAGSASSRAIARSPSKRRHLAREAVSGVVMEPAMIHDMKEAGGDFPAGRKPAPASMLVDLGPARAGILRAPAGDGRSRAGRQLRHERPSWLTVPRLVHRGSHRGDHAGYLRLPAASADRRPLYIGKDTHALSEPAQRTALEVLAANGVETIIQRDGGVTPTPVISWAILVYNRGRNEAPRGRHRRYGPSHNPPETAASKYNPPNGGSGRY